MEVKVDAKVPVPEILDLSVYRGLGLQPGEFLIPEGKISRRENRISKGRCVEESAILQLFYFHDNFYLAIFSAFYF